jgi:hypothetical protein
MSESLMENDGNAETLRLIVRRQCLDATFGLNCPEKNAAKAA